MSSRTLDELVLDLKQRRQAGERPPTLLLGAGASVEAGIGAMAELYKLAGVADFKAFSDYISNRTEAERFRFLMSFLQTMRPQDVTPGYRALAALCEDGFFDLILTTNLDPLLDDALAAARLWRKDYLLLVNGVLRGDRLLPLLRASVPRVKVLKLHGDLFHRFMAWTEGEMERFLEDLDPGLSEALEGRDLLVVGHSLRDARIARIATSALAGSGVVWYTHPVRRTDALPPHDRLREVIDPLCTFETLFTLLATRLDVVGIELGTSVLAPEPSGSVAAPAPMPVPGTTLAHDDPRAQTLDDLWAAVVGVGAYDGRAQATGVLIAEPRGILCDRLPLGKAVVGATVPVHSRNGDRWDLHVVRVLADSPFGPVLLEAPERWTAHPVGVDPRPVALGTVLRAAVFAGERPGISSGAVPGAIEVTVNIEPVGVVEGLVSLGLSVAPGSSGAPVVDPSLRLRGFIVAGSQDVHNPWSFMDPASRWHAQLSGGKPAGRPRRKKG
jgi:SIR2-like domain